MSTELDYQHSTHFRVVRLLLFACVLTLYLLTATPGLTGGDAGELQFVPAKLSLAHPTGTPLYCILGKLWTFLLPAAFVPWGMTLLAAVAASLAVVVVAASVDDTTQSTVAAIVTALLMALGTTFWSQAILPDKYAFNALMVALVLYLALRWGKRRTNHDLGLLAITYGLSLTHHRTMLLFAPMLLGYVWVIEGAELWKDWRRLLRLAGFVIAPLLLYLYLPLASARGLPPLEWQPHGISEWLAYFADRGFTQRVSLEGVQGNLIEFSRVLLQDYTWPGVVVGLFGIFALVRNRWRDAALLIGCFLIQTILASGYDVPRHEVFFLPAFVIWALFVGHGLASLLKITASWLVDRSRFWRAVFPSFAVVVLILAIPDYAARWDVFRALHQGGGVMDIWRQDLKSGYTADRLAAGMEQLAPDAVVVADWEQAAPLWCAQQIMGIRPDATILTPMDRLDEASEMGRPLAVARTVPGLETRGIPNGDGPLVSLLEKPNLAIPQDAQPLSISFVGGIELVGYRVDPTDGGFWGNDVRSVVPVTLYYRAISPPDADYAVSVRLVAPDGTEVARSDLAHPVLGTYPTLSWQVGQVIADYHELQLPAHADKVEYRVKVVFYETLDDGGWRNMEPLSDQPGWPTVSVSERV